MPNEFQKTIITRSPEETRTVGENLGSCVRPGAVIALSGDLGSGKTCLVQGLARGLGVPEECYVTSPSYTLINEYPGRCPLFHADLYRLNHAADLEDIGLYDMIWDGAGVAAIEWAGMLDKTLFSEYLEIHIEIQEDDSRKISVRNIKAAES